MTIPSTKVPTAREVARKVVHGELNGTGGGASECLWSHGFRCELLTDAVTAAIEARDTTIRSAVMEECAVAAGMFAAELLERHNAARKAGATSETLHDLSARWAAAGDCAARIRALATRTGGNENE